MVSRLKQRIIGTLKSVTPFVSYGYFLKKYEVPYKKIESTCLNGEPGYAFKPKWSWVDEEKYPHAKWVLPLSKAYSAIIGVTLIVAPIKCCANYTLTDELNPLKQYAALEYREELETLLFGKNGLADLNKDGTVTDVEKAVAHEKAGLTDGYTLKFHPISTSGLEDILNTLSK